MAAPCARRSASKLFCAAYSRRFEKVVQRCLSSTSVDPSNATIDEPPIEIPQYKKRTKTSILEALESTVKRDTNSPKYEYLDDNFLIPQTNWQRRHFALARDSGMKAARYVAQRYPKYFQCWYSVPSVAPYEEAPMPKEPSEYEPNETTVDVLQERISKHLPEFAFQSYQILRDAGQEIPETVVNDLLGLLCFYNSKNPTDENITRAYSFYEPMPRTINSETWEHDGPAEEVYRNLELPNAAAQNTLIQGLCKHGAVDKAFSHYHEMEDRGLKVELETYNCLIGLIHIHRSDVMTMGKIGKLKRLLQKLSDDGHFPTVHTFNQALAMLTKTRFSERSPEYAASVLAEMRICGIEPTLATWNFLVQIMFPPDYHASSSLFQEILNQMKGKSYKLEHIDDLKFFSSAMYKCKHTMNDLYLAYGLYDILNYSNNAYLLGNYHQETTFYNLLLELVCTFEDVDTIMEFYNKVTPHVALPLYPTFSDILLAVELSDSYKYIPKLWTDMLFYKYHNKGLFLEQILKIMAGKKQESKLQTTFMLIAEEAFTEANVAPRQKEMENKREITPQMTNLLLTGTMVGYMIKINLNGDDVNKAWERFDHYFKNRRIITMFPSEASLCGLAKHFLSEQDTDKVLNILTVVSEVAYPELDNLVERAKKELELTEEQFEKLNEML